MNIGQKIARIRELKRIKQSFVAKQLDISQQAYSKLEQSAKIPDETVDAIARILKVSTKAIKNFNEKHCLEGMTDQNTVVINYNISFSFHELDDETITRLMLSISEILKHIQNKKIILRLLPTPRQMKFLFRM